MYYHHVIQMHYMCGHCELNLSPLEEQVLFTLNYCFNSELRLALISLTPISWA